MCFCIYFSTTVLIPWWEREWGCDRGVRNIGVFRPEELGRIRGKGWRRNRAGLVMHLSARGSSFLPLCHTLAYGFRDCCTFDFGRDWGGRSRRNEGKNDATSVAQVGNHAHLPCSHLQKRPPPSPSVSEAITWGQQRHRTQRIQFQPPGLAEAAQKTGHSLSWRRSTGVQGGATHARAPTGSVLVEEDSRSQITFCFRITETLGRQREWVLRPEEILRHEADHLSRLRRHFVRTYTVVVEQRWSSHPAAWYWGADGVLWVGVAGEVCFACKKETDVGDGRFYESIWGWMTVIEHSSKHSRNYFFSLSALVYMPMSSFVRLAIGRYALVANLGWASHPLYNWKHCSKLSSTY